MINLEKHSRLFYLKIDLPFGGVEKINDPKFYFIPQNDFCDLATELDFKSMSLYFSVVLLWKFYTRILFCGMVRVFSVS